ncbi:VWA domain-containing protein [Christensenellaceae bacterium OttesenSCG-928-M15]|nr:VWA domain-containing protein [Christensenellaceae bacterium OttesenSCG-928-M15]
MKKGKKLLALLLAVMMVFGVTSALAEGDDEVKEVWAPAAYTQDGITLTKNVTGRIDEDTWEVTLGILNGSEEIVSKPIEVALVLDKSWSMNLCSDPTKTHGKNDISCEHISEEYPSRKDVLIQCAKELLDTFSKAGNVSVSISAFAGSATYIQEDMGVVNTENVATIKALLDDYPLDGSTNIEAGIKKGAATFTNTESEDMGRFMIVLSDGAANKSDSSGDTHAQHAINAAGDVKEYATVYGIALCTTGNDNDPSTADGTLKNIATDETKFYRATGAIELGKNFQKIAAEITAMVSDEMGSMFGEPENIAVSVGAATSDTGIAHFSNGILHWVPKGGTVAANTQVTIKYEISLKTIPDPTKAAKKDGHFNLIPTNASAELRYKLNTPGNKNFKTAKFPEPSVRFETGQLKVWEEIGNDRNENPLYTSKNVITDFLGYTPTVTNVPLAVKSQKVGNFDYDRNSIDVTDAKDVLHTDAQHNALEADDLIDDVNPKASADKISLVVPTGLSEIVYLYKKGNYTGPTGEIILTKDVVLNGADGDITDLQDNEFEFRVISSFGGVAIKEKDNPENTGPFKLKDGKSITLTDVPLADDELKIVELSGSVVINGYDFEGASLGSDEIEKQEDLSNGFVIGEVNGGATFTIKNEYAKSPYRAKLTLTKNVTGLAAGRDYTFTYAISNDGEAYKVDDRDYTVSITVRTDEYGNGSNTMDLSNFGELFGNQKKYDFTETDYQVSGYTWNSTQASSVSSSGATRSGTLAVTVSYDYNIETDAAVTFTNNYSTPGGSTDEPRDPVFRTTDDIPLGPITDGDEEEEIPLGPPMTGDMVTFGIAFVLIALGAVAAILVRRKRATNR